MSPPDAKNDNLFKLVEAQQKIHDRFTDIKRLGSGAFSLVFQSLDNQSGKRVALKVFDPFNKESYRWESFQRESSILELLKGQEGIIDLISPIATFEQVLEIEVPFKVTLPVDFHYYAVELASGDVETLINEATSDTETRLMIFHRMCKAVQRIHARKIVHRDLKPGNFLIMNDGTVRLSDFGTARQVGDSSKPLLDDYAGLPPGDIRYTAPEIISSLHDADPSFAFRGDFFSLGAILFELFTGIILGNQLFDRQFQEDLLRHMAVIPRDRRKEAYDGFIAQMADARPLPNIAAYAPTARRCILPIINDLFKNTAALDYQRRTDSFEYVFLKIQQALLVLRNEDKLKAWREKRELYKNNSELKRGRLAGGCSLTCVETRK